MREVMARQLLLSSGIEGGEKQVSTDVGIDARNGPWAPIERYYGCRGSAGHGEEKRRQQTAPYKSVR